MEFGAAFEDSAVPDTAPPAAAPGPVITETIETVVTTAPASLEIAGESFAAMPSLATLIPEKATSRSTSRAASRQASRAASRAGSTVANTATDSGALQPSDAAPSLEVAASENQAAASTSMAEKVVDALSSAAESAAEAISSLVHIPSRSDSRAGSRPPSRGRSAQPAALLAAPKTASRAGSRTGSRARSRDTSAAPDRGTETRASGALASVVEGDEGAAAHTGTQQPSLAAQEFPHVFGAL